jgi:homoserine O-acetyltransferase
MSHPHTAPLVENTYTLSNFRFANGQQIEALKIHYFTLGEPTRDEHGVINNAVLLLHNTTGSAKEWLEKEMAGELFGQGDILDQRTHYLIIPDAIGFGGSSKPSQGMRTQFPNYRYEDIVNAHHAFLSQALGIERLKLILGLSMGGMLTWMFGYMYPQFAQALCPIATQPGPMSGRNWIQRRISIEAIKNDPEWNQGHYTQNPSRFVFTAPFGGLMVQSVERLQALAPTRQAADALYETMVERARKTDANDRLYQLEASSDYDPSPHLKKIQAPLLAINFEDDELNPPQLGVLEKGIAQVSKGRCVLIKRGPHSAGHYTSLKAAAWKSHLTDFLNTIFLTKS